MTKVKHEQSDERVDKLYILKSQGAFMFNQKLKQIIERAKQ